LALQMNFGGRQWLLSSKLNLARRLRISRYYEFVEKNWRPSKSRSTCFS